MAKMQKPGLYQKLNKMDYSFLLVVFAILAFGLIMVFSASSATAHYQYGDAYYFIKRQFIWSLIGIGVMFLISRIPYKIFFKYTLHLMAITVFLLIAVLIFGTEVKGARRWLGIGPVSFQPSEIAKLAIILFLARSLSTNKEALKTFTKGFIPYVVIIGFVALLIFLEPHFSGAMVVALTGFIVMWAAGAKFSHFAMVGAAGLPVVAIAALSASYRLARVTTFLDPFKDASGDGWQIIQSLYAIGSGSFFGLGLGQSRQKFLYLPEPQNDFIFSIICEELGFIGALLVIALFALLIWKGVKIALNAPDRFSSLVVIGIISLIAVQAVLNIAVVTSSIPATGMPLPFFSYGGTSLVFILAEMGIVLSISRECEI